MARKKSEGVEVVSDGTVLSGAVDSSINKPSKPSLDKEVDAVVGHVLAASGGSVSMARRLELVEEVKKILGL